MVYGTVINHSSDALRPDYTGAVPPYRYEQLNEQIIRTAINAVRDRASPESYEYYMWGQRPGDPDNWVIRRLLYHTSGLQFLPMLTPTASV